MRTCAWALLAVLLVTSTATARTWTDTRGKTIEAEYVGQKDGKILVFSPSAGKIFQLAPETLSEQDQQFAVQAEQAAGLDILSKNIAADPMKSAAWAARGRSRASKNPEAAVSDFNIALTLDPKNADAYDGRGQAYKNKGDAAKAHNDYSKAIDADQKFAPAYKHRADNLLDYIKTPEGKPVYEEAAAKYRESYDKKAAASFKHAPWQPVHSVKAEMVGDVMRPMIQQDLLLAKKYETAVGGGGSGGGGGGGGGGVGGGPGVIGPTVVAPGVNPPLAVYPPIVVQGDYVTLEANGSELAKGLPTKVKPGAKVPGGKAPPEVESVDFYADSNSDGKFQPATDKYLGTDKEGKDGFNTKVSTSAFPLGNQAYFAVPRTGAAADNSLPLAANLLTALAEAEAKIAREAEAAKSSGLSAEKADALSKEQAQIASKIGSIATDVKLSAPEVAKLLAESRKPMGETKGELYKATKTPGAASMGSAAKAGLSADVAAKQLAMAAEQLTKAASGDEPPKPGSPGTGRPAAASGLINPPGGPAKGGSGGGGGGGPGKGGPGYAKDGPDKVVINNNNTTDDDEAIRRRWGDLDGLDVVSDEDRIRVRERARRLVADRDYDRAVVEYDRLLADEPDNLYLLRNRAHTYLQRGGYEDAVADYSKLITLDSENADFYYNRGCAYLAANKLDLAVADFTKSISLNETGNLAYNNRGITYARQGKFAEAVADLTMALKFDPSDRVSYHNRGLAYKNLGKAAEAEADFAKARELGAGG